MESGNDEYGEDNNINGDTIHVAWSKIHVHIHIHILIHLHIHQHVGKNPSKDSTSTDSHALQPGYYYLYLPSLFHAANFTACELRVRKAAFGIDTSVVAYHGPLTGLSSSTTIFILIFWRTLLLHECTRRNDTNIAGCLISSSDQ